MMCSFGAFAQEEQPAQKEYQYPNYGFWSNWSIGANGGVTLPLKGSDPNPNYTYNPSWGATLYFSKELNHVWDLRLIGTGHQINNGIGKALSMSVGTTFSIFDAIKGYNPERAWRLYLLASAGMGMDISGFEPLLPDTDITYDFLSGKYEELKKAVASVDEEWVQYFSEDSSIYCGFKDGEIACFCLVDFDAECILSDENSKVASIGCVGTVPKFRRNGYGLKMVENATLISKEKGCNKSFIHQTHLEGWYGKLGYKTVIKFSPVRKIF